MFARIYKGRQDGRTHLFWAGANNAHFNVRDTGSPGLASSRALPTTLSSTVGITASRCDDDLEGAAKGDGETDEEVDATGGGFCGSVDTGDLGWWERKKRYQRKIARGPGSDKEATCLEEQLRRRVVVVVVVKRAQPRVWVGDVCCESALVFR